MFVILWVYNDSEDELLIGVPENYLERQASNYNDSTNFLDLIEDYNSSTNRIISQEHLKERKNIFREILYELVNSHHENFLKSSGIEKTFDPLEKQTWVHLFKLESIPSIPQFEINKFSRNFYSANSFLKENDIKSNVLKEIMKNEEEIVSRGNRIDKMLEANRTVRDIINFSKAVNHRKNTYDNYMNIVTHVRNIFLFENRSVMSYDDVISKIEKVFEIKTKSKIDLFS